MFFKKLDIFAYLHKKLGQLFFMDGVENYLAVQIAEI